VGEEHQSDEFGKPAPTVFGANLNDPELTSLAAPYLIRQRGVDERAAAGRLVARPPWPSVVERVPLWVWALVLIVMFVVGLVGLMLGISHLGLGSPDSLSEVGSLRLP
jgi:hypothetical protein